MNKYELTIVLDGKATNAKKKTVTERIEKAVKANKGGVGKLTDWGVKDLAYKIKKSETGAFLIFPLELESKNVLDLSSKLRVDADVIRYLIVRKDK